MKKDNLFFLLPINSTRLNSVEDVYQGRSRAETYLFYGLDYFIRSGFKCNHNVYSLKQKKIISIVKLLYNKIITFIFVHPGDIEWSLPFLGRIKKADVLLIFSERGLFPIIYLRILMVIPRKPVICIPIDLVDKLRSMRIKRPIFFKCFIFELKKIYCLVVLSQDIKNVLSSEFGIEKNVIFLPAGVDTNYYKPATFVQYNYVDVLSIGADRFRDFHTLITVAKQLKYISFRIITTKEIASNFDRIPDNIQLWIDVPMSSIRNFISSCKIVVLPVKENLYSGATTLLLQSMAMGKAVVANEVGCNKFGYGFQNDKNLVFIKSENSLELKNAIIKLVNNVKIRKNIENNAREHVKNNLDISIFNANLKNVVERALTGHNI